MAHPRTEHEIVRKVIQKRTEKILNVNYDRQRSLQKLPVIHFNIKLSFFFACWTQAGLFMVLKENSEIINRYKIRGRVPLLLCYKSLWAGRLWRYHLGNYCRRIK